jgi:hypothetical protein
MSGRSEQGEGDSSGNGFAEMGRGTAPLRVVSSPPHGNDSPPSRTAFHHGVVEPDRRAPRIRSRASTTEMPIRRGGGRRPRGAARGARRDQSTAALARVLLSDYRSVGGMLCPSHDNLAPFKESSRSLNGYTIPRPQPEPRVAARRKCPERSRSRPALPMTAPDREVEACNPG